MPCTGRPSILAGLPQGEMVMRLAQMQRDYLDISSGRKAESGAYAQGDGSKSVTYTRATIGQLTIAIRQLQTELGIIDTPRRALTVSF